MNIVDYIEKYGNLTFEEKELTEIDKLLFSILSYIKYDGSVSYNSSNKKTLKQVCDDYFSTHDEKDFKNIFHTIRFSTVLLEKIKNMKRYSGLLLYNDIYIGDSKQQFSALTIELNSNLVYVSFEGTDHLVSGWREDCAMTYKKFVPAQIQAIRYLNRHFKFRNCEIILGGHSKGGNLALVSALYSNPMIFNRIKEVCSYDGPGLSVEQLKMSRYKRLKDRYNLFIPETSVFGLLLNVEDYQVVKTNKLPFFSHDPMTWKIEDDHFSTGKLSNFSKILDEGLDKWIDKYTKVERKSFFDCVFKVFENNNITSLIDVMDNYKLMIKIIKEARLLEPGVKSMAKDILTTYLKCNKEYLTEKFNRKVKND